uniref:Uncharacterized protein n=1 Tax=Trichobilharzia regenti TaxID=157069 RepID=A0AA85KFX7_TRIRE|nr:unnamed protein product [Trichobilharzia regenti]
MENVTWWNEKLWKSFIDHPNSVITKTSDIKPVVSDIRYTSQQSSLNLNRNEQWNNSQTPPVNAHLTSSQLNSSTDNKSVLQNTINFQSKSIEFQDASGMKPCNPQLYCNNLFHQICSRPVMNNLQSIYGNRNRPLGSLRVYYLTRPHSAATIGRSTSLQRTTSHESPASSSSIDRTLSYMNMVPPLSARRSSSTCLNLSRECSFSSLLQSTNTPTVKQSNAIDCSGKICPLHERSTTPLVYEGVNRKSMISNNNNNNYYSLSTRRRSAPKARTTTTLSETSQHTSPKPIRRASSACVDDKSYRYTNKFINDFKVSSGQQEYNRALSTGNEFIPLNSTRKVSYPSSSPMHQPAPSVQENDTRKKASTTKSNQSSSLSVIPLSFQNVKYFKYPTPQRRSIKPTSVITSNKHQPNKIPVVQLDTDRTASLYQYDKKVVKQTIETNHPDNEVNSTPFKSVKSATVIQPKTETILKVEDNPKKSCLSETTEEYTTLKDDTYEITVTTDKIDYDVSDHDNNNDNNYNKDEEVEGITKHSVESEIQSLLSEEQIQVTLKDADYQSYPTPILHTDISNSFQKDEWKISEEGVTPCKDAESKDNTSTETTQLQTFSDKDEFLRLDSSHHLMKVSVTQSLEEQNSNELNTLMNEKSDQISETKLCENNNEQSNDIFSNNEVENLSIHNELPACSSTSNNLELQPSPSSSFTVSPSSFQHHLSYMDDKWSYCTTTTTHTSTITMSTTQPIKSILKRSKSFIKPYTTNIISSEKIMSIPGASNVLNDNVQNEFISRRPSSANNYAWKSVLSTDNVNNQMSSTTVNNNKVWIRPKSSVQKNKLTPEEPHSTGRMNSNNNNNKPGVRFDIKNNAVYEFYPYDIIYKS